MNVRCQLCESDRLTSLLDLGPQPVSTRWRTDPTSPEPLFPLELRQCATCGLVQLGEPVPPAELMPRGFALSYTEPERHLDDWAAAIASQTQLSESAIVWGLTVKDDSLLARLRERVGCATYRLDPAADLQIDQPLAGVETIQQRITQLEAARCLANHAQPQLLVARHLAEHAQQLRPFLAALRALLPDDGYLAVEVPDCRPAFATLDYTIMWEEHVSYFTVATLTRALAVSGFEPVSVEVRPNGHESLVLAVARVARPGAWRSESSMAADELRLWATFAARLPELRARWVELLGDYRRRGTRVALLGAGHLACAFVQYLDLAAEISVVIDDDPRKQGLWMPGSRLPIQGSAALQSEDIELCLMSVNPEVEERVVARHQAFAARGGRLASIFPGSSRALITGARYDDS